MRREDGRAGPGEPGGVHGGPGGREGSVCARRSGVAGRPCPPSPLAPPQQCHVGARRGRPCHRPPPREAGVSPPLRSKGSPLSLPRPPR